MSRTRTMSVASSILDVVGNTPLVALSRIAATVKPTVFGKLESMNPGGSVKDRPALAMIADAEAKGLLKPGGTIVEPTSGNTGVGIAIAAALKGYRAIFVTIDKVASEKLDLLRAYGAKVVICPASVAPDHPDSYYSVSERLANEIPGAYMPNQFANPANPFAHETTTGPELWRQTDGQLTHFVAGMGTGGTIGGTAKYLKSQNPNIRVIGVDPFGSVYSGGTGRPYFVEGVGEDFFPQNYDDSNIDDVLSVRDADAFDMARRLAREEGILVGGSSGMALCGAMQVAQGAKNDDVIVVLLPDSGRGYLSKIFNDDWMRAYGFLEHNGFVIREVLEFKSDALPSMPSILGIRPETTVRDAVTIMRERNVSQLVVSSGDVSCDTPLAVGELRGIVSEGDLLQAVATRPRLATQAVQTFVTALPTIVGVGESVTHAIALLERDNALVVADGGNVVGLVTRTDVLDYCTSHSNFAPDSHPDSHQHLHQHLHPESETDS